MHTLRLGFNRLLIVLASCMPLTALAVDGVVLIDQNRALTGNVTPGDGPGFPVSINLPGIYKLASNLTVPNEFTTAIQINVDNVSIDLNGFAILGPNVCATDGFTPAQPCTRPSGNDFVGMGIDGGSAVAFNVRNTRISNGTIDGMGGIGIFLNVNSRIEKMNVSSNGSYGIYTFGGVILDTLVRANGKGGILTSGSVITGSRSIFNRGIGIQTGASSVLEGNIVDANLGLGMLLTPTTRYTNNTVNTNNGGGAQISSGTQAGVNSCGGAPCP